MLFLRGPTMFSPYDPAMQICLEYTFAARLQIEQALYHHMQFMRDLATITLQKTPTHQQYGFDLLLHQLLLEQLAHKGVRARFYSEESGWLDLGGDTFVIIVDPFDQSSMATRSVRGAAVVVTIATADLQLAAVAIADLSTHITYVANPSGTFVVTHDFLPAALDNLHAVNAKPAATKELAQAFVICPASRPKRRLALSRSRLFAQAGELLTIDGAVNFGRLAAGYIDAYLDPFVGQPLYEVACAALCQQAGAVVSDAQGQPFSLADLITRLGTNPETRYPIVAAATQQLHEELLAVLAKDRPPD